MTNQKQYDVLILGGSYAGLSAAMALGRLQQKVLVIDSGLPCNRQTPHSHNFLTQDGETPLAIAKKAKEQVLNYPTVEFYEGLALTGEKIHHGFQITTEKKHFFQSKKLIFASGIKDLMPDIKGLSVCWGISVIHCPYCHGYEFRGKKTAILANSDKAMHLASLVNNLTAHITVLTQGKANFSQEQLLKLQQKNIEVIETCVTDLNHNKGYVQSVVLKDATKLDFDVIYAPLAFEQNTTIPMLLGCELTVNGHLKIDAFQKTTVDGIYACGDNSSSMRSVAGAVASGSLAGVMVVKELTDERF
ncbi:NAD(P)/FAD-dependent oxidoreductase [Myroides odoratus]|uniref:NAD(P)/FAD-dependent oxidoreductase n=1 Tax=Myroides odoratus TaxID=256 RepID=UPI0039B0E619